MTRKLLAISDLHLAKAENLAALREVGDHASDWLILAGDIAERTEVLDEALRVLGERFAQLIWVPGNHDLWTLPSESPASKGEAKYQRLVEICRRRGVLTPEDPYPLWDGEGGPCVIAPLFLLYDYSYRPDDVSRADVLAWSLEEGIVCTDEHLLHPDPHPTRDAWCHARVASTAERLDKLGTLPTVLINHWPLRQDLAVLPRVPRFTPWCGTRLTDDWHLRYRAKAVVFGHLHIRGTRSRDGVRFEEVSFGYPGQWDPELGIDGYFQNILPGDDSIEDY
ncbi:MAG: metallophosphoesterase [Acidobacteriota bacterium]